MCIYLYLDTHVCIYLYLYLDIYTYMYMMFLALSLSLLSPLSLKKEFSMNGPWTCPTVWSLTVGDIYIYIYIYTHTSPNSIHIHKNMHIYIYMFFANSFVPFGFPLSFLLSQFSYDRLGLLKRQEESLPL